MSDWQPVGTAPHDGHTFLGGWWEDSPWYPGGDPVWTVRLVCWSKRRSNFQDPERGGRYRITHWMPLPAPPDLQSIKPEDRKA